MEDKNLNSLKLRIRNTDKLRISTAENYLTDHPGTISSSTSCCFLMKGKSVQAYCPFQQIKPLNVDKNPVSKSGITELRLIYNVIDC